MPPIASHAQPAAHGVSSGSVLEWLDDQASIGDHFAALDRPVRLVISVSTSTAFTLPIAQMACDPIQVLVPDRYSVETALTEAISNALIHGNLAMPTFGPATDEAHASYVRQVDQRLATRELAARRLTVGVDWDDDEVLILVVDSGDGYVPVERAAVPGRGGGMGFTIIRSLTTAFEVRHGGRCLALHFSRIGATVRS